MQTTIRPARADELQAAEELVVRSINDLTARHGFGAMASLRPADFQLFSHKDDPGGLWVAEADGAIAGFAFSWVCGKFWFLAELFVSPGLQGRGIGDALLQRTFQHALQAGAENKALITFTFNTVSQGLYIRHGLYPRLPIYFFKVETKAVRERGGETLRHADIADTDRDRARLAQLDMSALGFSRDKHHEFLFGDANTRGAFLYAGDDCVGYAYVNSGGHIGPVSVSQPGLMGAAFTTALRLAAQTGASDVSALVPGVNDAALDAAIAHGMRITFPMVLLSAREFGDFSRYLPRNPALM
jgi:ribosomal protein S18 acetylase RimI-like enzyme